MISLIESGKVQLTTVTAMILSDNFNKIAAEKGIELNLTLKDLLGNGRQDYERDLKNTFISLVEDGGSNADYDRLLVKAKKHNCFELIAEIEKAKGDNFALADKHEAAKLMKKLMNILNLLKIISVKLRFFFYW